MSDRMPGKMSHGMSEHMFDKISERRWREMCQIENKKTCTIKYHNTFQIQPSMKCQQVCQTGGLRISQNQCQKKKMSDRMSDEMSDRMSDKMSVDVDHVK